MSHGNRWHLAHSARPPVGCGLWCSGWSAPAPPGQLGEGPTGISKVRSGEGALGQVIGWVGSEDSRIAHWSELSHSRPPRCCWRRGQPQLLGTRSLAGDPAAACWSHQLGHSPAQGQRSLHLAQPSPQPPTYHFGHPYLSPLTGQWLSHPCQGSILDLVASHRATGCCPLHSQGLTAWLREHQVSWTKSRVIGWERGNGQSERRIGGRQLGCGIGDKGREHRG